VSAVVLVAWFGRCELFSIVALMLLLLLLPLLQQYDTKKYQHNRALIFDDTHPLPPIVYDIPLCTPTNMSY
jgi:hypothetical protein